MTAEVIVEMVPQPREELSANRHKHQTNTTSSHQTTSQNKVDVDMDVPKITVFKSPPWQKPVTPHLHVPNLHVPKLSHVYEEFPFKSKMLPRRLNMGMSRSLECIPENTVLHDTHKYSTVHLRDNNRLSPHQILPPIGGILAESDELPEMRQRAYSDPHRYSAAASSAARRKSNDSAAATVDKKESPLTRGSVSSSVTAAPQPSPPVKEKPADFQNNSVLTSEHKVQHRRTNTHQLKDSSTATVTRTSTSPTKSPASPAGVTRINNSSPLSSKPPRATVPPLRRKLADNTHSSSHSNPSTPESLLNRVNRNRKLVNKNLSSSGNSESGGVVITHPSVAALKDGGVSALTQQSRLRTNSLPTTLTEPKTRRRSSSLQTSELTVKPPKQEGLKSTVAYALIGSPGRSRWPSPERQTTSYINSEEESPIDTPPECLSDTENHPELSHHEQQQNSRSEVLFHRPNPKLDDNASREFKAILKDFKSSSSNGAANNSLNSITDPAEYFQKARRLDKPQW